MKDNLGLYFLTSLISAVVGAITPILVEIYKEWRKSRTRRTKKESSVQQEEQPVEKKDAKKKRITISVGIGIVIGIIVGISIAFLITHYCTSNNNELILWNFDNDIKDWTYFSSAQDAAKGAAHGEDTDLDTGVLIAKFNFAQVELNALPVGMEPRATVWADNQNMDWTGYTKLLIDVKNVDSQLLEMTFSLYTGGCFYEFSGYKSLSENASWQTIEFPFTLPKYKTCNAPNSKTSPGNVVGIEQFYIILGTNADHATIKNEDHVIFIDNIRLQK